MKVVRRHSKYADAVKRSLVYFGHSTNAQLCDDLRKSYPHLSDTTVHRITQRLFEDGAIGFATLNRWGAMVYDANTAPHDHFYCESCDSIRDISIPVDCRSSIHKSIGSCRLSSSLKITGSCQECLLDNKGE